MNPKYSYNSFSDGAHLVMEIFVLVHINEITTIAIQSFDKFKSVNIFNYIFTNGRKKQNVVHNK